MSSIGKVWAGNIYGTNTGNFFLKFDAVEPNVKGTLRHLDPIYGVAVYSVEGTFAETLELTGTVEQAQEGATYGSISISGQLTSEGSLRGEWTSSIGTGGTFIAHPHDQEKLAGQPSEKAIVPEQIYTHVIQLGSVSLYEKDVLALIAELKKDFQGARLIATYSTGLGESTKYVENFTQEFERLNSLTYLKLQIQEPEAHGINRVAIVELRAFGSNEVRVQGINESWVIGRASALENFLKGFGNVVITGYKKFGLNLNGLIFIGMLVAIPEINSILDRIVFMAAVFGMLALLLALHSRFIPNATIKLAGPVPSRAARLFPTIASWGAAIFTSIVASYIYTWLTS